MEDIQLALSKCRKGIETNIYKTFRLVNMADGDTVIKWNKSGEIDLYQKYDYLVNKIDQLKPGKYQLECATNMNSTYIDSFPFLVTKSLDLPALKKETVETVQSVNDESMITADEYKSLVTELSGLKTENMILKKECEMLRESKEEYKELADRMPDVDQPGVWSQLGVGLATALAEGLPDLFEALKGMKTQKSLSPDQSPGSDPQRELDSVCASIQQMYMSGREDVADTMLDEIKSKNLLMYNAICERIGLEENDQGTENNNEQKEA